MGEQKEEPKLKEESFGPLKKITSAGFVDVEKDDPKMLKRFAEEAGVDLDIEYGGDGKARARIVLPVVVPKKK